MNHNEKVENLKLDVIELRQKFQDRIEDFKDEMKNYAANTDAIEELKKRHNKEMAEYVTESNTKYTDLLQQKLDMEDKMSDDFKKDKKKMMSDFEKRLKEEVEKARVEEKQKADKILANAKADFSLKYEDLNRRKQEADERARAKQESLQAEIDSLKEQLQSRDSQVKSLENELAALKTEIKILKELGESSGSQN